MKSILEEVKSTIYKSQNNIIRYYDRHYMSSLIFYPNDKIFLDTSDIHTMYLSAKIAYWYFRPNTMEK